MAARAITQMKLKRDVEDALAISGTCSTDRCLDRADQLLRDLDELSGLSLGPRERFLVTRIESVLCEPPKHGEEAEP